MPDLPLAAELRANPELAGQPVAIASGPGPRAEIVAVSPSANRLGVRPFTTVTHARAVCGELRVRVASPALERAAREALLDAALGLSPRAALAPPAGGAWLAEAAVYVDAAGVTPLFQSEAGFASALAARSAGLGLHAAVAIASSRSAARIAARQLQAGEVRVLPPGAEAAFLAPLPVDVLDPPDALAEALTRFGVHYVRDLLALPPRALGTRLGPQVLELVARARGERAEAPLTVPESARLVEASDLEFAVEHLEPLRFVLQGLLSRLLARLDARALACGALLLNLELEGGGRDARRVGVAAPTLDRRSLLRLACHALEAAPPRAPVVGIGVETEGRPLPVDQLDLFRPSGPSPMALGRTLTELQSLCGGDRIGAPGVADDHRPHLFEMTPFRPTPRSGQKAPLPDPRGASDACGVPNEIDGASGERRASLATRALRPPVTAEVRTRGGRPERIRSAVAQGPVVQLAGPWRTTGGWWSPESRFAYDYFDVQTRDGIVSRLRYDHLRKRWEIDAVYD